MKKWAAVVALMVCACASADDEMPEPTQKTDAPYRLYRTQNIYIPLKLDTRYGLDLETTWDGVDGIPWDFESVGRGFEALRAHQTFSP
jgi:hypothetical protein